MIVCMRIEVKNLLTNQVVTTMVMAVSS